MSLKWSLTIKHPKLCKRKQMSYITFLVGVLPLLLISLTSLFTANNNGTFTYHILESKAS